MLFALPSNNRAPLRTREISSRKEEVKQEDGFIEGWDLCAPRRVSHHLWVSCFEHYKCWTWLRDYHLVTRVGYIWSVRLFTKARQSRLGFQSLDVRLSTVSPRLWRKRRQQKRAWGLPTKVGWLWAYPWMDDGTNGRTHGSMDGSRGKTSRKMTMTSFTL